MMETRMTSWSKLDVRVRGVWRGGVPSGELVVGGFELCDTAIRQDPPFHSRMRSMEPHRPPSPPSPAP